MKSNNPSLSPLGLLRVDASSKFAARGHEGADHPEKRGERWTSGPRTFAETRKGSGSRSHRSRTAYESGKSPNLSSRRTVPPGS